MVDGGWIKCARGGFRRRACVLPACLPAARALGAAGRAAGTGQGLRAPVETACYRTHTWSSRGPYTGDAW